MRTAVRGGLGRRAPKATRSPKCSTRATCFVAACLLGGCGSSSAVRQAKLNDPIIVVTVQSTPKKTSDKPKKTPADADNVAKANDRAREEAVRSAGILGVLRSDDPNDVMGGVVGGVIGGSGQGFGGLGLSGVGIGGGGIGGGIGLGTIGTIGRGTEHGLIGLVGRGSSERLKVKLGHVLVTGPLTLDVVQRQIDEHRDDLQACQDLEHKQAGGRWGSATLRLKIDATGHVTDVQVYETTLSSRDLESCMAHVAGAFEFPSPGANASAIVLLPVTF